MEISVSGLQKLDERQVVAVSGLFPGENVTLKQVQSAADRLAKYGPLEQVAFQYQTQGSQMNLEFKVIEAQNMLRCRFVNFVWFSPEELNRELSRDVPLYQGSAPAEGEMLHRIKSVLRGMLKSKDITGDVQVLPFTPGLGQPIDAMDFSVTGVTLPIRQMHFPGASDIRESTLVKDSEALIGQSYDATEVGTFVNQSLLPQYLERGYLRAQFGMAQALPLTVNPRASSQDVSVTVPVHEGLSYDWSGATWSCNHVFSSEELNKFLSMRTGSVANEIKYEQGLTSVRNVYLSHGYLQVKISAKQDFDDAARAVRYELAIDEGSQFRMGTVSVTAPSDRMIKPLLKMWKIKEGAVFDGTYPTKFMNEAMRYIFTLGIRVHTTNIDFHPGASSHTINVEIVFR